MLKVITSNRMEVLAARLAGSLAERPLGDPVEPEVVLIPSRGMETWLSMQISEALGIAANIRFSFPAKEVRRALAGALALLDGTPAPDPDAGAGDPWDPDRVTWAILQELPACLGDPRFRPLEGYLAAGGSRLAEGAVSRREHALAGRIANLFDEYANHRPRWVREWSKPDVAARLESLEGVDAGNAWQPLLWSCVQRRLGVVHPLARLPEATRVLSAGGVPGLPSRLAVFGISTLPPVFLEVLQALSARVDVTILALTPVQGYYGHLRTRREKAALRSGERAADPADLHDDGPPLLESMGRLGRDFNEILAGLLQDDPEDLCVDPVADEGRGTMLAHLQADLLALQDPGGLGKDAPPAREVEGPDGSLQFHACHGSLRQVEVLRDELLRLFREHRDLQPRDVVVMCPDVDTYAPLIDAVFSDGDRAGKPAGEGGRAGFPEMRFAVSDRNARGLNPAADAVAGVLDLCTGRMPASAVLDLLALEPVQGRFGLDGDDLERIRSWLADARPRWGLDEDHRAAEGQPRDRQNTWGFGLDRLVLGVAMPASAAGARGQRTFQGVLPCDEVEGGAARVLGRFLRFCETLFAARRELESGGRARPAEAWKALVGDLLDAFVKVPEGRFWQVRKVREAMSSLADEARAAGLERPVDLDAVRQVLDGRLAAGGSTAGLLKGGINFSALVPMRSIPFRVVCLLGMDDGAFPRQQRRPGFDLMARGMRPGDRNPREDDRTLFLEALLSARDAVVVTWNGRGIRDNGELPPAVPVGELLDAVSRGFCTPGLSFQDFRARLVHVHPLQAFSPDAFRDPLPGEPPRRRSFDARNLDAAKALEGPREPAWRFFDGQVLPAPKEWIVTVDDLASFLEHPARFLARRRLGIVLDGREGAVEDREPVEIGGLEDWALGDELMQALLEGAPVEEARERIRLQGRLPLGVPGRRRVDAFEKEARALVEEARSLDLGDPVEAGVEASIGAPPVRLTGSLGGLRRREPSGETAQVVLSYGKVKARRILAAWARHLAACAAVPGFGGTTHVVGRFSGSSGFEAHEVFRDVAAEGATLADRARAELERLLGLYRIGWCQPLLLLPDSSFQFADAVRTVKDPARAGGAGWSEAEKAFRRNEREGYPNEEGDPDWAWVLGDTMPWKKGVDLPVPGLVDALRPEALALSVWKPLLRSLGRSWVEEVVP